MDRTNAMANSVHVTMAPEANPMVVHAISRLLARDFKEARDSDDLSSRLAHKGFQIRLGYLATAPQGKLICPLSSI